MLTHRVSIAIFYCVRERARVCVCERPRACVCVCVCVYVRVLRMGEKYQIVHEVLFASYCFLLGTFTRTLRAIVECRSDVELVTTCKTAVADALTKRSEHLASDLESCAADIESEETECFSSSEWKHIICCFFN